MALRDKLTNMWVSPDKADKERVQTKLAEAETKLRELEAAVETTALKLARDGSDDLAPIILARAKVRAQQDVVEACRRMVAEEDKIEQGRQREAAIKASRARLNSMRQIVGRRVAAAERFQQGVRLMVESYDELQEVAKRAEPLAPPYPSWQHASHWLPLQIGSQRRLVAREFVRQGLRGQNLTERQTVSDLPGVAELRGYAIGAIGHSDLVHEMPDIVTAVKAENQIILAGFEQELGLGNPTANPPPPVTGGNQPVHPDPVAAPTPAPQPPPVTYAMAAVDPNRAMIDAQLNRPDDRQLSPAELEANAGRTLAAAYIEKPAPRAVAPSLTEVDRAAEETLRAVEGVKLNPYPEGTPEYEDMEATLQMIKQLNARGKNV